MTPNAFQAFGGVARNADEFDEILVTPAHRNRLSGLVITPGGLPDFGGVKVTADENVTEGYGVLRQSGKVIGMIDFTTQNVVFVERSKR